MGILKWMVVAVVGGLYAYLLFRLKRWREPHRRKALDACAALLLEPERAEGAAVLGQRRGLSMVVSLAQGLDIECRCGNPARQCFGFATPARGARPKGDPLPRKGLRLWGETELARSFLDATTERELRSTGARKLSFEAFPEGFRLRLSPSPRAQSLPAVATAIDRCSMRLSGKLLEALAPTVGASAVGKAHEALAAHLWARRLALGAIVLGGGVLCALTALP